MSTPAVVPEVTTPEVTVNNTAAEILASHTAEKQAQTTPPVEAPAAPTTPAPAAVEAKPYVITKNADGSVNVDITEGGEKFTGTMDEVLEKVAASKAAGNTYIKTLKAPVAPTTPEVTTTPAAPAQWMPDETTSVNALNGMLTNGNFGDAVGIGLAQMFGTDNPAQVRQAIGDLLQLSAELKGQKEISQFAQKAPDFPWAESNTAMLVQELTSRNMPITADNMVFAHNALKGMGRYQAVPVKAAVAEVPNPAPPNGNGAAPFKAEPNLWTMPLNELEADIRSGR